MDIAIRKVKASKIVSQKRPYSKRDSRFMEVHNRLASLAVGEAIRITFGEPVGRLANPIRAYFEGRATFSIRRMDREGLIWGVIRKS